MQVDKGGVVVYKMNITQQHINDGFAIGANSAQGSRFKLLLFQQCSDGEWGQLAQVSFDPSCPDLPVWATLGAYHGLPETACLQNT